VITQTSQMGNVNTRTAECMVGGSIFASKLNFKSEREVKMESIKSYLLVTVI
jgi:hypothetical protein